MSSMVCQGLQSCLEPRLVEPRALLGLKMVATISHSVKPNKLSESSADSDIEDDKNFTSCNDKVAKKEDSDGGESGGWSSIQAISETASIEAKVEEEQKPYVHPLYKRSASQLSTKSLELCTETLGSETGSDIGEDIDISFFSSSDSEGSKSPTKERSRLPRHSFGGQKGKNYGSLPPPLTSISGSNSYSIRPYREDGRLIMKAVLVPSSPSKCLKAERRDGRLILHYIKNSDSASASDQEQEDQRMEDHQEECVEEEMNGNNANVGGEIGRGKFVQRPSRCKEGGRGSNKGLLIWEPFWVAT